MNEYKNTLEHQEDISSDTNVEEETSSHDNHEYDEFFFDFEQEKFMDCRNATDYRNIIQQKYDIEQLKWWSLRLFSHHYSEFLAMEWDFWWAKKWNKIAYDFNSPNKVTKWLYLYFNNLIDDLSSFIIEHQWDYEIDSLITQIEAIEDSNNKLWLSKLKQIKNLKDLL